MIQIGKINTLKVIKHTDFGVYLDGFDGLEILLPLRYAPEACHAGDLIEVFLYYDSEDRLIATTEKPFAMVGDFALLKVVSMASVGAFLSWGLSKDLFLPFAEQTRSLRVGQEILVYIYTDKSGRLSASMRIERHLKKTPGEYKEGQSVSLMIAGETDLGFKAIINGEHLGVLYANDVFQPLHQGQQLKGFIKKIRDDSKIDLSLNQSGHRAAVTDIAPLILEKLHASGGYLEINDKTSAEIIYDLLGVSKKKYKIALGSLYKKQLITVHDDGIRLVKK